MKKTIAQFPNVIFGGAVLSSGIVSPPKALDGYGPNFSLTSYQQFEHVINVNLLGTYCVAQKVSEILLKNEPMNQDGERGIIITVSSILGLDGLIVGYGTSKGIFTKCAFIKSNLIYSNHLAGIAGLTLPLAKELSPFGIRVMSIAPGVFGKIMCKFAFFFLNFNKTLLDTPIVDRSSNTTPLALFPKRLGNPNEFADLVLQIIQMPMLNGSVIRLDGALRA